MPNQNTILADILDRNAAVTESDNLLAALADHGVFVPVNENNSVMFLEVDGATALPGYVSEEFCMQKCPGAAYAVHCDGPRLIDIKRQTKVPLLAVFSTDGWAKVPLSLLVRTLQQRGQQTQGDQTLKLSWTTHPLAIALRDATRDRLLDFPGIQTVWIAQAKWLESGNEQLMVHMEISDDAAPDQPKRLMETLLSEHVSLTDEDPLLSARTLNPTTEAQAIHEINAMGLDTIRANHTTGRVEVISHEYD
jgi:hypothetical protein